MAARIFQAVLPIIVEGEFVRDGVNRSEISLSGFGETHKLVPTGDGVRAPQDRRVEIILP